MPARKADIVMQRGSRSQSVQPGMVGFAIVDAPDGELARDRLQLRTMEATSADAFCMFFSPELIALKPWKLQERGTKRGSRRGVQVLR